MAAVRCFENVFKELSGNIRKLEIISFENDLDPLKLATKNNIYFPHLHHSAPFKLLQNHLWEHSSGLLTWKLVQGDFKELFSQEKQPDIIFYDPFSPKTNSELWTVDFFKLLFKYLKEKNVSIYTYSSSTLVRASLLCAGFYVASGVGTGPKSNTTKAFTLMPNEEENLLNSDWLDRWKRSGSQFPNEYDENMKKQFSDAIIMHPQFTKH